MRQRRILLTNENIKELIRSGNPFVQINNRIFDDVYENKESKFTDLDMIILIFLKLLQFNKFTLKRKEIAKFLNCSERQLKDSITKMKNIQVKINNIYSPRTDLYYLQEKEVPLITEKELLGWDNGKLAPLQQWYVNFEVDREESDGGLKPVNFFIVDINDLELLTSGKLTRPEFVLYLFFLRLHGKREIFIKKSTICQRLNIKLISTLDKYINRLVEIKLIEIKYPENFQRKLEARVEPSYHFIPLKEMNFEKMEMNLEKMEINF